MRRIIFIALLIVLASYPVFAQVNLTNGLVAHYTLDGHAADSSGNNLHGFMFGGSDVADRFSQPGKARQFNGNGDFISVPHNNILNLTGDKTISLWYYLQPGALLLYPSLVYKYGSTDYPTFGIFFRQDPAYGTSRHKVSFIQGKGTTNKENYTKQKYTDYYNQWIHIAASFSTSDGYMRIYFNGILSDSLFAGTTFTSNTSTDSMQIGRGNKFGYSQGYFKGYLDDVRIYNRKLNVAEINALFGKTVSYSTTNIQICSGDSILAGGEYQKTTGAYYDTINLNPGHDSIVITSLQVHPSYIIPVLVSICPGDSVFLGGQYRTTGGIYSDSLTTIKGCDSLVLTVLTILPSYTIPRTVNICYGDSIVVNGKGIFTNGTYVDSLKTIMGCDSLIQITLNVTTIDTGVDQITGGLKSLHDSASYRWLDCDNAYAPVSGATAQVFYPTAVGMYAVEVTKNGCTDTSTCYTVASVGIHKYIRTSFIKVYPNPASNILTVEFDAKPGEVKLQLMDYTGRLVKKEGIANMPGKWKKEIELNNLPQGIYFLLIEGEGFKHVEKIQVATE